MSNERDQGEEPQPNTRRPPTERHGPEAYERASRVGATPQPPAAGERKSGRTPLPPQTGYNSISGYEELPVAAPEAGPTRQYGQVPYGLLPQRVAGGPVEPPESSRSPRIQPARTAAEPPASPTPIKIGLWGGPGSGKTTFIGALKTAVEQRQRNSDEEWSITPADGASLEFMNSANQQLLLEKSFPAATQQAGRYNFLIRGEIPAPAVPKIFRRRIPNRRLVTFTLTMHDRPGGAYSNESLREDPTPIRELADCQGLLYLFDPLDKASNKDTLIFFQSTLARLAAEMERRGGFVGAKLPHYLAVCITKFDDIRIFELAREWGMLDSHPVSGTTPHVPDHLASRFFDRLCDESPGTAEYVRDAIRSNFMSERVHYYVVASIGYNRLSKSLAYKDTTNSVQSPDDPDKMIIRTNLHPVNVVEPVIGLERLIRLGNAR